MIDCNYVLQLNQATKMGEVDSKFAILGWIMGLNQVLDLNLGLIPIRKHEKHANFHSLVCLMGNNDVIVGHYGQLD